MMKALSSGRKWTVGTLSYTASGIVTLFCLLLLGDFSNSIKDRSIYQIVQLMFKTYGASDFLNGLLMVSLPSAFGLILGPIISYRSDRCRSRLGRRLPYLLLTTPIAAMAIVGFAFSPMLGKFLAPLLGTPENPTILFLLGICWAVFEFATVISVALFGALVNDVVPEKLLGRFFGLFRAIALLAGILFNYWFLGYAQSHYFWLFLVIALIYAGGFMIMCLKIKEGEYPPPEKQARKGFFHAAKVYFSECYSDPYYLLLFVFLTFTGLTFAPVNSFSMFYAQSLNVPMDHYGKYLAITYMISLAASYFLGILADRFHPLRTGLLALGAYGAAALISWITISGEITFAVAFIAHGVLSGSYFTLTASLQQRLLPRDRFGQFHSAAGIMCALFYIGTIPLVGKFLDYTGHQYRYVFFWGGIFALISLATGLYLYRQFNRHGGVDHYQAPGTERTEEAAAFLREESKRS